MVLTYPQARPLINTGDLISVRGKHGLLARIMRIGGATYTHSGVAIWFNNGLWMAELNGGRNHIVPLSQLAGASFDVHYPPVPDQNAIEAATQERLREPIDYSLLALVVIGLFNLLGIPFPGRTARFLVCSSYCADIYIKAGWADRPRLLSPDELAGLLHKKLEVRP